MKKHISLLLVLMILLSGCSKSDNPDGSAKDNATEDAIEAVCPSVVLTINPSIELFYDADYNVVSCEYINEDAKDAWSDIDVTGKNVSDVLEELITVAKEKEYLNYDNKDIQIILTKEDSVLQETISQMIDEYVEASDTSVIVNLEQIDENNNTVVLSTAEKDTDALTTENIAGIWVSEEWVNPTVTWLNPNFTRTVVFMDDGTAIQVLYVSENGVNFSSNPRIFMNSFTWTEDGTLKSTSYVLDYYGTCGYNNLESDLITMVSEDGIVSQQCIFKFKLENGKLYLYNSDNEYVVYHKVNSFEDLYSSNWFDGVLSVYNSMDYANPKSKYNDLYNLHNIYWDGNRYTDGTTNYFTKDGNRYTQIPNSIS